MNLSKGLYPFDLDLGILLTSAFFLDLALDVYELGVRAHFLFLGFMLGLTLGFDLWISWKLPTGFFMELDTIFNFILGVPS